MGFNYTNGFHDAANAIATSVSTRALTPRVALAMAAVMNFVGAFLGAKVAKTVGDGHHRRCPSGTSGLVVVFAALIGAIAWNLITWYFGLPSSSSHALIGGLVGAALAAGATVQWRGVVDKVVIPMVLSPVVGFVLGYLRDAGDPVDLPAGATRARSPAASGCAQTGLGRGDGARPRPAGRREDDGRRRPRPRSSAATTTGDSDPALGAASSTAAVLAAGTYAGGWRIMRTLGRRIIHLDPPQGFAAETTARVDPLRRRASCFGAPISTTHTITSAIMGVGATKRLSAVRWGVAGNIVIAWVLTFPGAGLVAAVAYVVSTLLG